VHDGGWKNFRSSVDRDKMWLRLKDVVFEAVGTLKKGEEGRKWESHNGWMALKGS
jgi:hypothetical protein